ncbi:hypothetical protein FRC10_005815 [Ceratobasidium sp. 414]|nr:hypothetical protein FRC10_005815 [Ceratobasidium sp. 414]
MSHRLSATAWESGHNGNLGSYKSPSDFLAAIGRSSDTKLKVETWDDLWRMRGEDMKKAGLTPAERRYVLWGLEKFRQGQDPAAIAIKVRPKKTIRGAGAASLHVSFLSQLGASGAEWQKGTIGPDYASYCVV